MKLDVSCSLPACAFVVIALTASPVAAGGSHSASTIHKGHPGGHGGAVGFYHSSGNLANGVSIFNQRNSSRDLPNGVSIFNQRNSSGDLPNGVSIFNQRNNSPPVASGDPGKRTYARDLSIEARVNSKHRREAKAKSRMNDNSYRRYSEDMSKTKRAFGEDSGPVQATPVTIATPSVVYVEPQDAGQADCRSLRERGYDRTGRRVLVEWTVCFDEQGAAYVPDRGRRILARF